MNAPSFICCAASGAFACSTRTMAYLQRLAEYWGTCYDWRAWETRLNAYPQFITEIDGASVHFLHVRSPEPDALPLILCHGWPGSFVEFLNVIGPLSDPRTHGADPTDAFHLVIPSMPGYGFSGPMKETGWSTSRVAQAWKALMQRLGYQRYSAQGGDWGAFVAPDLGRIDAEHVVGVMSTRPHSASSRSDPSTRPNYPRSATSSGLA